MATWRRRQPADQLQRIPLVGQRRAEARQRAVGRDPVGHATLADHFYDAPNLTYNFNFPPTLKPPSIPVNSKVSATDYYMYYPFNVGHLRAYAGQTFSPRCHTSMHRANKSRSD